MPDDPAQPRRLVRAGARCGLPWPGRRHRLGPCRRARLARASHRAGDRAAPAVSLARRVLRARHPPVLPGRRDTGPLGAASARLRSACIGAFVLRGRVWALSALIALAAIFAGFAAGAMRDRQRRRRPCSTASSIAPLTGFIESVEDRAGRAAAAPAAGRARRMAPQAERPRRVRVSVRKGAQLSAGQFIAGTRPPAAAARGRLAGRLRFRPRRLFKGIGAVGSIVGQRRGARRRRPRRRIGPLQLAAQVDAARNALTQRIAAAIGGPAGGVGAALVTGKRGLIRRAHERRAARRRASTTSCRSRACTWCSRPARSSGCARALLALAPAFALLWPVKKIAAVVAMVGADGLLHLLRLGGRDRALARHDPRDVRRGARGPAGPEHPQPAIAALIVLAREPEALLGPSFQMSFGAVAALIGARAAAAADGRRRGRSTGCSSGACAGSRARAVGLARSRPWSRASRPRRSPPITSRRLNPYGLIGNALALPLVSLVVMPSAVLGVLAYPFGLDRPVWQLMGCGRRAGARGLRLGRRLQRLDGRGPGSGHRRARRC